MLNKKQDKNNLTNKLFLSLSFPSRVMLHKSERKHFVPVIITRHDGNDRVTLELSRSSRRARFQHFSE